MLTFFLLALVSWLSANTLERALAELRELNVQLDSRVVERTRDLAAALAKNQAILDSTADGVIVFDRESRAVIANPSALDLLARPLENVVGQDAETLMDNDVSADDRSTLARLLEEQKTQRSGLKIGWGSKTLSVTLAPVRDYDGRTTGTVAVFRDFTREAQVDRTKSTFISIASHELRTPLNAILGYAEMLEHDVFGALTTRQHAALERVVANIGQMLSLVNNLLDQAQMEAGMLTLSIASLSPVELIVGVKGVMDVIAQAKGLDLTSQIAASVPARVEGDWQRLHQILINLVNNAIKFTERGWVNIHVYAPDETHWAIEISDTGCGIPREAHDYIFDPFRQVEDPTTRKYGGAGLGLSIVKRLTGLMGGELYLESELDRGSSFTIVLPTIFSKDRARLDENREKAIIPQDEQSIGQKTDPAQEGDL
jgi:PAS domain S-box-containing protein